MLALLFGHLGLVLISVVWEMDLVMFLMDFYGLCMCVLDVGTCLSSKQWLGTVPMFMITPLLVC
jgi:hypothetical protein